MWFLFVALMVHCLPTHASVIFSTLLLADSSKFSAKAFSSLVLDATNATSITLHSVEPDTITGVQGRQVFAESGSADLGFYTFQLLHVTRVRSSIEVADEGSASAVIRHSLANRALLRGMGLMGIESLEIGEVGVTWLQYLTTTYLDLPSFVAQYLIVGWVLTVLGFALCVTCYCCRRDQHVVMAASVPLDPSHIPVIIMPVPSGPMPALASLDAVGGQHKEKKSTVMGSQMNTSFSSRQPPTVIVTPPMVPLRRDKGAAARASEISNARRILHQQQEKMQ